MEKSRIEIMEKVIAFSDKLKLLTFDDIYNKINVATLESMLKAQEQREAKKKKAAEVPLDL